MVFILGVLLFFNSDVIAQTTMSHKAKVQDAEVFVKDLGARAIKTLTTGTQEQISQNFLKLLDEGFDVDYIARFVLGRYWRDFSTDQQAEFKVLFRNRLEHTYSIHFREYKEIDFTVKSSRKEKNFEIVETIIQKPNGPVTPVQWKVASVDGIYKIRDVVVEGVSMGNTLRSDYSAAYQGVGATPGALLKKMEETPKF